MRPYTPTALRKFCASETESYIRDGSNALVFEGAWGTRRYVANKTFVLPAWLAGFCFQAAQPPSADDHLEEKNNVTQGAAFLAGKAAGAPWAVRTGRLARMPWSSVPMRALCSAGPGAWFLNRAIYLLARDHLDEMVL